MGFITNAFAGILNTIFNMVYSSSPVFSLGITIILFTLFVKLLLLPLAIKQFVSTKKMQRIQPELKKLQDKYKNKKDAESQQEMAKEMQALYAQHGTSPFGGCLPALIQLPIIISLFGVLRRATFYISKLSEIYTSLANKIIAIANHKELLSNLVDLKKLRIKDLDTIENIKTSLSGLTPNQWTELTTKMSPESAQTVTNLLDNKANIENFFGINLINLPGEMFNFAQIDTYIYLIIPILTAFTTYLTMQMTSKQNKQVSTKDSDSTAAQMENSMKTMTYFIPGLIFITTWSMPAGLGIYWLLGNLISLLQQFFFTKYIKTETKEGAR